MWRGYWTVGEGYGGLERVMNSVVPCAGLRAAGDE